MRSWRKLLAAGAGVAACVGVSLAAVWAGYVHVPLVRVPTPSGPWPVGTVTLEIGPPSARSVQVWYPAPLGTRGATAPYAESAQRTSRTRLLGAVVATDSVASAPLASLRSPLILYVSGWGGRRENNTAVFEDLASNGYVVAAFDDPYPLPALDFSSQGTRARTVARAERKLRMEATDAERLLDTLATLERTPGSRFAGRFDATRVGILGFSFGGAVAAELARRDPRVAAIVNLDGWLFGDALRDGVARPLLVVSAPLAGSQPPPLHFATDGERIIDAFDRENERLQLAGLRRHGGFLAVLDGTDHYNFTDAAWLPSLRHTGLGSLDGRRGTRIVATYVRQFFDRELKNRSTPVFDALESLDGAVRLRVFKGDAA